MFYGTNKLVFSPPLKGVFYGKRQKGVIMELVLNTFGTSLNRDNEAFVVSNKKGRQRVPVDGVTSIQIGRGVQVTSDAVLLAIEHEIDVLFMD